ncbi:MAG: hypothetical protein ACLFTG_11340 [Alphaproteobacteria bacterium]
MLARMRSRGSALAAGLVVPPAGLAAATARARDRAARRISGARWPSAEDDCGYVDDRAKGEATRGLPPGTAREGLGEDRVCTWRRL